MDDRNETERKRIFSRRYFLIAGGSIISAGILTSCTPKAIIETITNPITSTSTQIEFEKTTSLTETTISSTNTETKTSSSPLTTTSSPFSTTTQSKQTVTNLTSTPATSSILTTTTQTTTVTNTPITPTNTVTTATSSDLTTTTKSVIIIPTLPLEVLDYPEVPRITAEELKKLFDGNTKPVIVDTRNITSLNIEHIPGALNMPYSEAILNPIKMEMAILSLPKDRLVVFY